MRDMTQAPQIMKEVFQILPNAWLFAGTLLGFIREGIILPWDQDIDLGVNSDDINVDIINEFKKSGFKIRKLTTFKEDEIQKYVPNSKNFFSKLVLHKHTVKVEIMCFKQGIPGNRTGQVSDILYYRTGVAKQPPRLFALPVYMAYPIKKDRIYDFDINVPKNYKDQLSYIYGDDWETPKKQWYFTPEHYLCRERTTIELHNDDGSRWSKYTGRKIIENAYGPQNFPKDINEVFILKN